MRFNFKAKIIMIVILLLIITGVVFLFVSSNAMMDYAQIRMQNEYREEARTMATVWKYRSGGGFKNVDGVEMTYTDEDLYNNIKGYYDTWVSLNTTQAKMTVLQPTSNGFVRKYSSLTDKNGKSMEGTYLDDEAVLSRIAQHKQEGVMDFTGLVEIGGKKYLASYCFFYKDDDGEIPFILTLCEEIASVRSSLMKTLTPYIIWTIFGFIVLFAAAVAVIIKIINLDITRRVAKSTNTLQKAANLVDKNARSITESGHGFASDSKMQVSSIEQISQSISQTSEMIQQTTDGMLETSKITSDLSAKLAEGNQKMEQMTETISNIKKSSDEIGKIIKVIDDIASQTNILALNAAVEAARAGEAGKGFAVVAEEVRNLAQKSAEAAKSSGGIIEENIKLSDVGVEVCESVSNSFAAISDDVEKVNAITKESTNAVSEEAAGIERVVSAVKSIEELTTNVSSKAEENVSYSEALQTEMTNVSDVISELKSILG